MREDEKTDLCVGAENPCSAPDQVIKAALKIATATARLKILYGCKDAKK